MTDSAATILIVDDDLFSALLPKGRASAGRLVQPALKQVAAKALVAFKAHPAGGRHGTVGVLQAAQNPTINT